MSNYLDWKQRWHQSLVDYHKELFDYESKELKQQYAEQTNCPVCGSPEATLWFEKDWFRHVRCNSCSMVYINPRLNETATHAFYNGAVNAIYNETKFDQVSDSTSLDDQINLANLRSIESFREGKTGTLLEIGCAKGYFLSEARKAGYEVYGLELNEVNYNYSRKTIGDTVINKDLMDVHFETGKFDVVYMRDVIEHIPVPMDFLEELHRVMKPGGTIFFDTHNVDGWIYKIVGGRHTVFFPFEHPIHWSVKTISTALSKSGFRVKKTPQSSIDFTLLDILSYWVEPGFTSIYPRPVPSWVKVPMRLLQLVLSVRFVRWVDKTLFPFIADLAGNGSVMKVIAERES